MTKISQYSVDQNIRGNDKWIGSDSQNYLMTKNFTPNGLADFFNNNNVIDIGVSIRYTYQTLDPGEQREQGTISFETEIGPQVNFSAISTFLLAKKTLKYNDVSQYLDFLIDSKVIISKASNINIFGFYKITDIQPYLPDTDFFVVTLEFITGNGFIYEDLDYLISLVDKSQDAIVPSLQQVLVVGNTTGGNDISISDGDAIVLDNGSKLKKGTTDAGLGGLGGIALRCSVDYELKWDAGRLFIMQQDGFTIRETLYNFNITPTASDDNTKGYTIGSRWVLDNGDIYECTDNTTGAAVWTFVNTGGIPTLQQVLDNNHELSNGNLYIGTNSGTTNTGNNVNSLGYAATYSNTGNFVNALGSNAAEGNVGNNVNAIGYYSANSNTGNSINAIGSNALDNNIGNDVNAFGSNAGSTNSYDNVNLFGENAEATANGQTVLSVDGDIMVRIDASDLTASQQYDLPDASGTLALTSDIPSLSGYATELWVGNNYYPLSTNPAGYLIQDDVQEYADLASFPNPGTIGVIYVALDTGLFYTWNGSSYISSSPPNTGITGVGTTNYLPKFTSPTQVGNSGFSEASNGTGGFYGRFTNNIGQYVSFWQNSSESFKVARAQTSISFQLGYNFPSWIYSSNIDGLELWSNGDLFFSSGTTSPGVGTERMRINKTTGNVGIGTTSPSQKLHVSGNARVTGAYYDSNNSAGTSGQILSSTVTGTDWIDPPTVTGTIPHTTASGTDTYTATVTGVTAYNDGDAYLVRFTNGNTTTATLNINSLGAVTLYRNNDGHLIGGDIWAGAEMLCVYNSTLNVFQCIGTSPNALFSYVTNDDSITLTKGMPVYAFGGTGDRMTVKRANNTTDATSAQTVGIVASTSIAANQKGIIIIQGLLDGLSILPTSTFSDGDPVYLGSTAGAITNVKPYAPNHLVYLGVVTTASNGSAGRMYVRVQNGYELDELHNVQAQSPVDKATLYYDLAATQWKTDTIAGVLGYTPVTNARTISTTSPLSGGGDLSANRTLSITQANTSTDGYLSSTDWNTFNGKQAATSSAILSTLGWYNYKNTVSSSTLTGTTAETQLLQVTIPANTFAATDFVKFIVDFSKTGTAGTATYRVKLSTSATMPSGATSQVGVYTTAATNLFIKMNRNLSVKSGNITGFPFTATQVSDINVSNAAISSVAFDVTVTQYLYVSATLANSSDSTYMNSIQITNI